MIDDPIRAIISAVGFVLVIALPFVAAILWRRRARALWSSLIYGSVTSATTYLVWRHLHFEVSQFLGDIIPNEAFWGGMWHYWILLWLVYGLTQESMRWLMLRYLAKNVRSWREGVMYGIGCGGTVMLLRVGSFFFNMLTEDTDLDRHSLIDVMAAELAMIRWWQMLYAAWTWVVEMVFALCASLVVLLGVLRRDMRLLLAAVLLHIVLNAAPTVIWNHFPGLHLTGLRTVLYTLTMIPLARFLTLLLPLWLIFRLHKPLAAAAATA